MYRFFIDPSTIKSSEATIVGPESRHIRKVLRMVPGDTICLFDGNGNIYRAVIEKITKDKVKTTIFQKEKIKPEPPYLHIGIGLLKGAKTDLIIQKATELGANTILPFTSQHCVAHKNKARLDRWERITFESCKQCGRPVPPVLKPLQDFKGILKTPAEKDTKIIFWEKEASVNLHDIISPSDSVQSVFAMIGPEGGFSDEEIALAQNAGFHSVTLGKITLRAETAAIAAMSILQFQLGNLNKNA